MSCSLSARPTRVAFREALDFAYDSLRVRKISSALTALGMFVGTAALILVVSISMAGKQYVLKQIESIGVNWIFAEYQAPAQSIVGVTPDPLTIDDLQAVLRDVPSVVAASPVAPLVERVQVTGGRERDLQVLGVYPDYERVRNLVILSGRFLDLSDLHARSKVVLMTEKLAVQLYGSISMATGNVVKLEGLPFTVIGTFRERVDTFGQSELTGNTMVVPYTVSRFFTEGENVKQLYFSVGDSSMVVSATDQVRKVVQSRHRPESIYLVSNLTSLVAMADRTARGLALVLLLIAVVTLLVGGIGIMNIMLATVAARTHEIGIRKALGATNGAIRFQFLSEAVLISLAGGIVGIGVGLGFPTVVRILTDYQIPISYVSAVVALVACSFVGMLFGTLPAIRAAQSDPIESLRQE